MAKEVRKNRPARNDARIGKAAGNEVVLDDFLGAVAYARQSFRLPSPKFSMKDIESYPGAALALRKLIQHIVRFSNGGVYSMPDPFLTSDGRIYSEPIKAKAYSGRRILPEWVEFALRRMLELGLQTMVQLPDRGPKSEYTRRKILSMALALTKLGEAVGNGLDGSSELRGRVEVYFKTDTASRMRLMGLTRELHWAGGALEAIAKCRMKRIKTDSPNPQVRFALYLAGWIRAGAGRPHYSHVKTLVDAAFHAGKKKPPKWADRLEVEMVSKARYRRAWARSISHGGHD